MKRYFSDGKGLLLSPEDYWYSLFHYNAGEKPRAWELDAFRGVLILYLVFDALCVLLTRFQVTFDTAFGLRFAEFANEYVGSSFRHGFEPFSFYLLCFYQGLSCAFTHSHFRRASRLSLSYLLIWGIYVLLSLVHPDIFVGYVLFDVLAVLALCYVFWWILELIRCPLWIRSAMTILIICAGVTFYYKTFMQDNTFWVENDFLSLLVYNGHGYALSGYSFQPLIPHLGFFMMGGILGKSMYSHQKSVSNRKAPALLYPVLFCGKHYFGMLTVAPMVLLLVVYTICRLV